MSITIFAEQLYYTSCRWGLGPSDGFQVRAASGSMSAPDRAEVVQRCGYLPPAGLPCEPSAEVIDAEFPPDLVVGITPDGRPILVHQVYTGQDHTLRWGNFFAHGLILPAIPTDFWPVDILGAPFWVRRLTDDRSAAPPPPLPPLSAEVTQPPFSAGDLAELLGERPSNVERLASMIRALLAHKRTSRSVVLGGPWLDALAWLTALQHALPPAVAWKISWSTLSTEVRSTARVTIVPDVARVVITQDHRRFYHYVFTPDGDSEVPAATEDYGATIARWMATAPDRLRAFHDFATGFELGEDDEQLEDLLALFRAADPGRATAIAGLIRHVDFVVRYTNPRGAEQANTRLADAMARHAPGASGSEFALLVDALRAVRGPGAEALVEGAWLHLVRATLGGRGGAADQVLQLRPNRLAAGEGARSAMDMLLRPEGARELIEAWRAAPAIAPDMINLLLSLAHATGDPADLERVLQMVSAVGAPRLAALAVETLRQMTGADWPAWADRLASATLLPGYRATLGQLAVRDPHEAARMVARWRTPSHLPAAQAIATAIAEDTPDLAQAWAWLEAHALGRCLSFTTAIGAMLPRLGAPGTTQLVTIWLTPPLLDPVEIDIALPVLQYAAGLVPLNPKEPDSGLAERVSRRARDLGLEGRLMPHRSWLRSLSDSAKHEDPTDLLKHYPLSDHLAALSPEERAAWVSSWIALALDRVNEQPITLRMIRALPADPGTVHAAWHTALTANGAQTSPRRLTTSWQAWFEDARMCSNRQALPPLHGNFAKLLRAVSAKAPEAVWKITQTDVAETLTAGERVIWEGQCSQIAESRHPGGILNRVWSWFRSSPRDEA